MNLLIITGAVLTGLGAFVGGIVASSLAAVLVFRHVRRPHGA